MTMTWDTYAMTQPTRWVSIVAAPATDNHESYENRPSEPEGSAVLNNSLRAIF